MALPVQTVRWCWSRAGRLGGRRDLAAPGRDHRMVPCAAIRRLLRSWAAWAGTSTPADAAFSYMEEGWDAATRPSAATCPQVRRLALRQRRPHQAAISMRLTDSNTHVTLINELVQHTLCQDSDTECVRVFKMLPTGRPMCRSQELARRAGLGC